MSVTRELQEIKDSVADNITSLEKVAADVLIDMIKGDPQNFVQQLAADNGIELTPLLEGYITAIKAGNEFLESLNGLRG